MKYLRELCLIILILIEGIFKLDQGIGFAAYLLVFILGLFLIFRHYDVSVFLFIPIIRLAGVATPLAFDLKAIIITCFLAVLIVLHVVYAHMRIGHDYFISLLRSKKRMLSASAFGMILVALILGILLWRLEPPVITGGLGFFLAVFAGIIEEVYLRGLVLSKDTRIRFILLTSIWSGLLVFSGNLWAFGIALVFSLYAGFFLSKVRVIYIPILCHIIINLIPLRL